MNKKTDGFSTAAEVLRERQTQIKEILLQNEYQYYGGYLAEKLGDQAHASLYMKLAKDTDRSLLEQALDFVRRSANVENKAKLFMWWLEKLRKGSK